MTVIKTCTRCGETKPLDEFWRDRRNRDGRGSHCKGCKGVKQRGGWPIPIGLIPAEPTPGWYHQAACLQVPIGSGEDDDPFYPTHQLQTASDVPAAAFEACWSCPVRVDCLAAGLAEKEGIWGGTGPSDRARLRRAMKRRETVRQMSAQAADRKAS